MAAAGSRGRLLRRAAVGLVLVALALLACEGLAQLVLGPPRRGDDSVVPVEVGRYDPDRGWALRANARAVSERTGVPIEYGINSHGLRDAETTWDKPPGTFRIVLLGDSRTFGYGVAIEQHFSTLLEGYLRDVETLNLGVSGYGVDQELLFLRAQGMRYEPDLVLAYVAHFGAERHMHTERFGERKPRFVLEEGELVLEGAPVWPPPEADEPGLLRRAHRWLRRRSRAYELLRNRAVGLVHGGELAAREVAQTGGEAEAARRREVVEVGAAIVRAMRDEAEGAGAGFVLVTQVPELAAEIRADGVPVLDPTAALANPRFALPDGFGHLNEAGNGVLAWTIARFLDGEGLVPPAHGLARAAAAVEEAWLEGQEGR